MSEIRCYNCGNTERFFVSDRDNLMTCCNCGTIFLGAKVDYSIKHDKDKPRLDLVPPAIIEGVGEVRTFGKEKYGEKSWKDVEPERYRAAMMRHICLYLRNPEGKDDESGLSHLKHVACNVAFLLEIEKESGQK